MRLTRLPLLALFFCASFVGLHAQSTTTATVLRPYITSLSPQSLLTGLDSTVLTINGKRFQRGAAVYFNARKLTNVRIDGDSVIVAVVPGELTVNADVAVLLVENSDETRIGMRVWVRHICDIELPLRPRITPYTTNATMQAFRLTVANGAVQDFKPNARLFLSGTPLTIIRNDGRTLIADVPAILNTVGTYALQLVPENVCFNQIYTISFALDPRTAPAITRVTPSILLPNSGNVTIEGINFSTSVRVFLDSFQLTIVSNNIARIVVAIPASLPFGDYLISVINPDGRTASQTIHYGPDHVLVLSRTTTLSPNPVTTALTLETTIDRAATLTLTLRNILGEAVLQEHHAAASGRFTATLDVSTHANGIYLLEASDGAGGRWVQKVVKY